MEEIEIYFFDKILLQVFKNDSKLFANLTNVFKAISKLQSPGINEVDEIHRKAKDTIAAIMNNHSSNIF